MKKGLFLAEVTKAEECRYLRQIFGEIIFGMGNPEIQLLKIKQFHDDGENGEEERIYDVYKLYTDVQVYVLKKSSGEEITIYQDFLENHAFAVPRYYGHIADGRGTEWLLLECVPGTDLREYNEKIAVTAAKSIAKIHNFYWQDPEEPSVDGRFEHYWSRICRRAKCLKHEPELKRAYQVFLERQKECPRTLCNGDLLQYNGIFDGKKTIIIDWAFGGIMPYSLDIARMITHGTEKRYPFPYYMNDEQRKLFVETYYSRMEPKVDWDRYIQDIVLAALNECVEFMEVELLDETLERDAGFEFYYGIAQKIAGMIG